MSQGIKKAKQAFNRMVKPPKAGGPVTSHKGATKKGPHGPTGHKAPNASKGKGTGFRPARTKAGPGFPTGHKAKNTTHGKG